MKFDKTITFATLAYFALASDVQPRDVSGTANVYFGDELGEPGLYAAGFIYGIPDQADQIPDEFYDNFGFQYTRAGGAQTDAAGWIDGLDSYKARFTSALSNYQTALQHGGKFILLPHDIWGADSVQSSTAPFPGDDGNWTSFDQYLDTLIADMNDNGMQADLTIDIWNEPNGSGFWNCEQSQYLDMWGRAYAGFRDAFPDVPISGPSTSYSPTDDDWWSAWFEFIVANNSIPDEHSWHGLSSSFGDARQMVENYDTLLESNGGARNDGPVVINEYGAVREQNPSGSAWWIAQLERANIWGLRANWESGLALHDFFGQILGKPTAGADDYDAEGTGYYTTAEYLVYKYYASTMTGTRVRTEPTEDVIGDVYVTVDDGVVRMLVGTRYSTGEWTIQLNNLTELGLPESGTLDIQTLAFPGTEDKYVEVDEATDLGSNSHDYSDGTLSFAIDMTDPYTTWAFEFSV